VVAYQISQRAWYSLYGSLESTGKGFTGGFRVITLDEYHKMAKPSKYRNKPTTIDGIHYGSIKEAKRGQALLWEQKMGGITELKMQVPFLIEVNGQKVCKYIADFTYKLKGKLIVEDTKSPASRTPTYKLKKRLMKACLGIDIYET
jgi:hypothetical protein